MAVSISKTNMTMQVNNTTGCDISCDFDGTDQDRFDIGESLGVIPLDGSKGNMVVETYLDGTKIRTQAFIFNKDKWTSDLAAWKTAEDADGAGVKSYRVNVGGNFQVNTQWGGYEGSGLELNYLASDLAGTCEC